MNRNVFAATLLAAGAVASIGQAGPGSALAPARTATGEGTMAFGDHEDRSDDGDGRAYLRFEVEDSDPVVGSLTFAAEHHHGMFPDVVVRLGTFDEIDFGSDWVKFSGPGRLFDDPITVQVQAYDKKRADRFVIKCTDPSGAVVFEADGELFRGDIVIGGGL